MTAPNQHATAEAAGTYSLVEHARALQSILTNLSTLTGHQLAELFRQHATRPDFPQLLQAAFPQIVEPHAHAAAQVTSQWYDELAPPTDFRATPKVDLPAERVAKTVDWALYAPTEKKLEEHVYQAEPDVSLSRLVESSQRMVFDASRDTVITNSTGQTRYARYASADACAFCRLLATRSDEYLYRSSESAVQVVGVGRGDRVRGPRAVGEKFHDHCRCIIVPIPAGESWNAPSYVGDWQQQYQAAREAAGDYPSTNDILAQMRANTGAK